MEDSRWSDRNYSKRSSPVKHSSKKAGWTARAPKPPLNPSLSTPSSSVPIDHGSTHVALTVAQDSPEALVHDKARKRIEQLIHDGTQAVQESDVKDPASQAIHHDASSTFPVGNWIPAEGQYTWTHERRKSEESLSQRDAHSTPTSAPATATAPAAAISTPISVEASEDNKDASQAPYTPQSKSTNVITVNQSDNPHITDSHFKNTTVPVPEPQTAWLPYALRSLSPVVDAPPTDHTVEFPWEFLHQTLAGEQVFPNFYCAEKALPGFPYKAFWIIDAGLEPFLASAPGQHGAKLMPFAHNGPLTWANLNTDRALFHNTPIFVKPAQGLHYRYHGNYSQTRATDRLGHDTLMEHVPTSIRKHWATVLTHPARPAWIAQELKSHFWPKESFNDFLRSHPITPISLPPSATKPPPTPSFAHLLDGVHRALAKYMQHLADWDRDTAGKEHTLTADALMKAFENADADPEPGLRLWLRYLECVAYDVAFYDALVALQHRSEC